MGKVFGQFVLSSRVRHYSTLASFQSLNRDNRLTPSTISLGIWPSPVLTFNYAEFLSPVRYETMHWTDHKRHRENEQL